MASDASKGLLDRVQTKVSRKQRSKLRGYVGAYVERNGVMWRVVAMSKNGKSVVLSDLKTGPDQLLTMSARAFLSRKIRPAERKDDGHEFVKSPDTKKKEKK